LSIGDIWNIVILAPMINVLIIVSQYLFHNFGLAIIALTIVIRLATLPLTTKQAKATKSIQELQPKLAELQKKYARDRQKLAQEQMRLYKESGVNPAGCMLPMLIQMPIWIALFQSIIKVLAVIPEDFLSLSKFLYPTWSSVFTLVPLESRFLWLDLAVPDRFLILPILVGGTMWLQQKMSMPAVADPRQQAQSQMMLWMMPLMFAFFTLQFPSGLALYWVASNIISIIIQYRVSGWGGLITPKPTKPVKTPFKLVSREETKREVTSSESAPSETKSAETTPAELPGKKSIFSYLPWKSRAQHKKK